MKKIIILIIASLILISCWSKENNNSNEKNVNQNNSNDINLDNKPRIQETKVETKVKNWELTIWEKVLIKKWKAADFPADFPIIEWWEIYQNSNMQWYAFIIKKDKTINEIYTYYKKELVNKWYSDKSVFPKNKKMEDMKSLNLEFTKWNEKIIVNINNEVPKVLVENLWLKWNFIEIYITK